MDDLPRNYDTIILGTGMIEAIIAGALSRIGKSVLHLDSNDYYGENWASFNLENIEDWIENSKTCDINIESEKNNFYSFIDRSETFVKIKKICNAKNVQKNNFVSPKINENNEIIDNSLSEENMLEKRDPALSISTLENKLHSLGRKFNLDLSPKLLYSRGSMVELLISSNVAKYAEFKNCNRVLTWRNNQLETVPCSRADVFATKNVSVVQKRILIKILTLLANYENNPQEFKGFEDKTFLNFLESKKVPDNLIHYILYAIAMGDKTTPCLKGVKSCKAFLESLGRFGNTPFIFPMYGSGELPQCFCRLCAVFGGIYCLKREVEGLILKDDQCIGVVSDGIRLNAKNIIISSSYFIENYSEVENTFATNRGIFITDRSLLSSERETLTLLQFPPQVLNYPATIIELGSNTYTCPESFYVVHITSKATETSASDLKNIIDVLFDMQKDMNNEQSNKPKILWSLTWNFNSDCRLKEDISLKNIKICSGVDAELDYDQAINEAKLIFNEMNPGEEFLPRAPDPDEIILEVEDKI